MFVAAAQRATHHQREGDDSVLPPSIQILEELVGRRPYRSGVERGVALTLGDFFFPVGPPRQEVDPVLRLTRDAVNAARLDAGLAPQEVAAQVLEDHGIELVEGRFLAGRETGLERDERRAVRRRLVLPGSTHACRAPTARAGIERPRRSLASSWSARPQMVTRVRF